MVSGNDILEHTEKCDSCMKLQEEIDNGNLSEEKERNLNQEIYECYCNSFGEE